MKIYLIRHGESEANLTGHLVGGRTPKAQLTDKGKLQAQLLAAIFKQKTTFTKLYSSSLVRAVQTATIVNELTNQNLDLITVPELVELSEGDWEGQLYSQIYNDKQTNISNSSGGWFSSPGGDSQIDVQVRVLSWFVNCINNLWNDDDVIAVFAHKVVNNTIIQSILNFDRSYMYKLEIDNCGYHYLEFDKNICTFTKVRLSQNTQG